MTQNQSRSFRLLRSAPTWRLPLLGLAAGCAGFLASPAHAEYRLASGDTIEVTIAGEPGLGRRARIDLDGRVAVPLIGEMPAAGLSLDDLRAQIQTGMASKVLRRRSADGREYPVTFSSDEISVDVAEYRPVYISGDVSKPGEQGFRPGMTLRQAVALAGGYDIVSQRIASPAFQIADLNAQRDLLLPQLADAQANIARIQAEIGGKNEISGSQIAAAGGADTVPPGLVQTQNTQISLRNAGQEREKTYLVEAQKAVQSRIEALNDQQQKESQGAQEDVNELTRAQNLSQRGLLTSDRLVDARRSQLLSATRLLQTLAETAQSEKDKQELAWKIGSFDDQHKLELLQALQDASLKLAMVRSQIRGVDEKLMVLGPRSQLIANDRQKPQLAIFRNAASGGQIAADENTELLPGDVVDVKLPRRPFPELSME
ncbi:polysaccharide export outer membrane protein [Faunimonas pinastri]|uniref:Polysaccharide export outer membrane protein n=1 Tax=Faunimonas pinastri TaxID=1855383 RepID=A0A1H9PHR7_9HYPH|nr:polysaccharide biosynthesis/export family protein [Faunimonas pinastri]SER47772.1 polysaccharide export outer membrane protein [Faunimonas pinastri]